MGNNDESPAFCTRCGATLPEGATFCPGCGATVGDDAEPYVQRPQAQTGRFGLAPMILVYGIFATIIGLMDVVTYIGLDEATYVDLVNQMSEISGIDAWTIMPAWTPDMALLMTLSMACLTVSGVLAVACFAICRKGENWKVSIMLCVASTVMCLGICAFTMFASLGIPLFAIGLVMTVLMFVKKDTFVS